MDPAVAALALRPPIVPPSSKTCQQKILYREPTSSRVISS